VICSLPNFWGVNSGKSTSKIYTFIFEILRPTSSQFMRIFPSDLILHNYRVTTTSLNKIYLNLNYMGTTIIIKFELLGETVLPRFLWHSYTILHAGRDRSGGPTQVWRLRYHSQILLDSNQTRYESNRATWIPRILATIQLSIFSTSISYLKRQTCIQLYIF
jgi:hypothetical protein